MKFCKAVAERYGSIVVVEDIENLGDVINQYDELIKSMSVAQESNNAKFNAELEKMVEEMF